MLGRETCKLIINDNYFYHLLSANLYRWSSAGTTSISRIYFVLGFRPVTLTLKLGNILLKKEKKKRICVKLLVLQTHIHTQARAHTSTSPTSRGEVNKCWKCGKFPTFVQLLEDFNGLQISTNIVRKARNSARHSTTQAPRDTRPTA